MDDQMLAAMGEASLRDMANTPYVSLTAVHLDEIDAALGAIAGQVDYDASSH